MQYVDRGNTGGIPFADTDKYGIVELGSGIKRNDVGKISVDYTGSSADFFFRKASTDYKEGDICYLPMLGARYRLYCVKAGTTSASDLDLSYMLDSIGGGQLIIDGTLTWIVDDTTDTNMVGNVVSSLYVPNGYILANGQTINREKYPRLVNFVTKYNLWTEDTTTNLGLYGVGDGSTTITVPNFMGMFAEFADKAGAKVDAGLPNITGDIGILAAMHPWESCVSSTNGAFSLVRNIRTVVGTSTGSQDACPIYNFNASHSNSIYGNSTTVQPASIKLLPIIKV